MVEERGFGKLCPWTEQVENPYPTDIVPWWYACTSDSDHKYIKYTIGCFTSPCSFARWMNCPVNPEPPASLINNQGGER